MTPFWGTRSAIVDADPPPSPFRCLRRLPPSPLKEREFQQALCIDGRRLRGFWIAVFPACAGTGKPGNDVLFDGSAQSRAFGIQKGSRHALGRYHWVWLVLGVFFVLCDSASSRERVLPREGAEKKERRGWPALPGIQGGRAMTIFQKSVTPLSPWADRVWSTPSCRPAGSRPACSRRGRGGWRRGRRGGRRCR